MSRFQKPSQVLWPCQYQVVWTPALGHRVLTGPVHEEVHHGVDMFSDQLGCEMVGLNIEAHHIPVITTGPPQVSISQVMGALKARAARGVVNHFPSL